MRANFLLIGVSVATLWGCKPPSDPAKVCASQLTADGLASVALGEAGLPMQDVHLNLDSPVLDSFDKATQRVNCTASFRLTFTGSLAKLDAAKGEASLAGGLQLNGQPGEEALQVLTSRQTYTVQAAADGRGLVYTLGRAQVAALQAWAAAAQLTSAAPATAVEPNAPSGGAATGQNATSADANITDPAQSDAAAGDNPADTARNTAAPGNS